MKTKCETDIETIHKKFTNVRNTVKNSTNNIFDDGKNIHKCPDYYLKAYHNMTKPIKVGVEFTKKTPIYKAFDYVATNNPDLVFLGKIIFVLVFSGLIYLLYQWLIHHKIPNFGLDQLKTNILNMGSNDVPMSVINNAQIESDALKQHSDFFSNQPFSLENLGVYELTRGVLILPFIVFFIHYVLPFISLIYIGWFLYNYIGYITRAIGGFITEVAIKYMIRFAVCKIASIIPFFKFPCPSLYGYIMDWKKEYVDRPIYEEKVKYFKRYYIQKLKYYDLPKEIYINQTIEKGKVKTEYGSKFLTRCKDVFYQQFMKNKQKIDTNYNNVENKTSSVFNTIYDKLPQNPFKKEQPCDQQSTSISRSINSICDGIDKKYSMFRIIIGLILCLLSFTIIGTFLYCRIYGIPLWLYDYIGPLYRYQLSDNNMKLLSNKWNLLLIALFFIFFTVIIFYSFRYNLNIVNKKHTDDD